MMATEEDTFQALQQVPFLQVASECYSRTRFGQQILRVNEDYIKSCGWSIEDFSAKFSALSGTEHVRLFLDRG